MRYRWVREPIKPSSPCAHRNIKKVMNRNFHVPKEWYYKMARENHMRSKPKPRDLLDYQTEDMNHSVRCKHHCEPGAPGLMSPKRGGCCKGSRLR